VEPVILEINLEMDLLR